MFRFERRTGRHGHFVGGPKPSRSQTKISRQILERGSSFQYTKTLVGRGESFVGHAEEFVHSFPRFSLIGRGMFAAHGCQVMRRLANEHVLHRFAPITLGAQATERTKYAARWFPFVSLSVNLKEPSRWSAWCSSIFVRT